ncbi:shikimate dehydrogenase [Angulomicrobium tetraedrale]|uniref:shikimate dehydrogenase (NADP(+)) n=1 Tax=Ancylobacter tetraedralis TaxID=217068 RepID=A0A839ZDR1_9HYPH|nr:shikimate dehydrogenase [Ancylobacter tetraedralis]MBB3772772.1 shikimate dehydrogenase [Ancylobacter tetraedralis]
MQITGETDLFFIVGAPVRHFRAPIMFNDYFAAKGHDFSCAGLHVLPADLAATFDLVRKVDNIKGLCITIPHKIDAVPLVDRLTEAGKRVGSVNFVRREPDGSLTGHNIDGQGFMRGLANNGFDPQGADVVQVGVGGVGRAIAFSLASSGVARITLINRDAERARRLAEEIEAATGTRVVALKADERPDLGRATLLVNATSVGMVGNIALPLELSGLTPACTVADVVLKPDETELLAAARALGCACVPGTAMLKPQIELCEEFLYGEASPG